MKPNQSEDSTSCLHSGGVWRENKAAVGSHSQPGCERVARIGGKGALEQLHENVCSPPQSWKEKVQRRSAAYACSGLYNLQLSWMELTACVWKPTRKWTDLVFLASGTSKMVGCEVLLNHNGAGGLHLPWWFTRCVGLIYGLSARECIFIAQSTSTCFWHCLPNIDHAARLLPMWHLRPMNTLKY